MANNDGTFVQEEEKEFSRFYRFSKWYVTNRESLKKIGYAVFITVDALLLLFVLWTFIDTYLISYNAEHRAVSEMVAFGQDDLRSYSVATSADPLVSGEVTVISIGDGRYDYYSTLTNPNADWWAEFTYTFSSSDTAEPEVYSGFILPNEEKPVVALSVESDSVPKGVAFTMQDVTWHRVDRHLVGDFAEWYGDRFSFDIQGASWSTDGEGEKPIGRVEFTVTNDTAYSYYDVVFYILLMRGDRVVGVTRTTLSSLDSYQSQLMTVNWFGTLPSVGQVEIIPEVNVFDVAVYKPLQGETTTDTRTRVFRRR